MDLRGRTVPERRHGAPVEEDGALCTRLGREDEGLLTYAIGDVHGCADLLAELLDRIEAHRAGRDRRLVTLGDYVDRGPDSAGVVAMLRDLAAREPDRVTCLMGNHEDMLLIAHREPLVIPDWIRIGGDATLASYGVPDPADLPADAVAWIAGLPTLHEDEWRYFVHAGFRPGRPALSANHRTRLWIRGPFVDQDHDFGKHVVHGHTPVPSGEPQVTPYRTNLDTGAVYGRALTAGIFEDGRPGPAGFLRARR
jgi:serine/threonine protein phosphatase 1